MENFNGTKLCIRWLKGIFRLGIKAPITPDDIYKPKASLESEPIVDTFSKVWSDELKHKNPSLLRLVFRVFGIWLLFWGILTGISDTLLKSVKYFHRRMGRVYFYKNMR